MKRKVRLRSFEARTQRNFLTNGKVDEYDIVNHPSHYTSHPSGVECITLTEHMPFNIGHVFKYLWRAGLKDSAPTAEDYNKACWYLIREMKRQGVKLTVGAAEIEGAR